MWPDRVSNQGPLALELDALPTAQGGPTGALSIYEISPLRQRQHITLRQRRIKVDTT